MEDLSELNYIHVGERIKSLLGAKGITQAELSRRTDKAAQNVNRAMDRQSMTTDFLQEILHVTGIKSWEVFEQPGPNDKHLYEELLEDKRTIIALREQLAGYMSAKES